MINRSGESPIASTASEEKNANPSTAPSTNSPSVSANDDDIILTVSGYIINRASIEISPRFIGVVKWIAVKQGETDTNNQAVVLLDDTEYQVRLAQADGAVAATRAPVAQAELSFERVHKLAATDIASKQA